MRVIQLPFKDLFGTADVSVTALHFAPDGLSLVAVARLDYAVCPLGWDLQRGAPVDLGSAGDWIWGGHEEGDAPDPVPSPDHRLLAFVHVDRGPEYSLRLFDRSGPSKPGARGVRLTTPAHARGISLDYLALQFSPDGRHLVAAVAGAGEEDDADPGREAGVYCWDVEAVLRGRGPKANRQFLPKLAPFPMPEPDVRCTEADLIQGVGGRERAGVGRTLVFSPDGSSLAAGLWRCRVCRWRFPSGEELPAPQVKARLTPGAWRLAASPDGRTLAVADTTVTLYDAATAAPTATLSEAGTTAPSPKRSRARAPVFGLAFDPSGRVLATACGDRLVRWWESGTGALREAFEWGVGRVSAIEFSPDGCLCAAAGEKGRVVVWDVDK